MRKRSIQPIVTYSPPVLDYAALSAGLAKMLAPPKPTVLSLSTRKKMHAIGWTVVRQSQLSMGRECPWRLHLSMAKLNARQMSCHALLGTVFHRAIELNLPVSEMTVELWIYLMSNIVADNDTHYLYRGSPVRECDIIDLAQDLSTGRSLGVPLATLVMQVVAKLKETMVVPLSIEEFMNYTDGVEYPIQFQGTVDMVAQFGPARAIIDCKTSGLWGPILDGKGSVTKQSYTSDELFCHTQLRHYDWLRVKLGLGKAQVYALMTPVNLVPYKVGTEKGQARGGLLLSVGGVSEADLIGYETDVVRFIERFVDGPYRSFPTNFGKPLCPGCPYYNGCIKDNSASAEASLIPDYLKE